MKKVLLTLHIVFFIFNVSKGQFQDSVESINGSRFLLSELCFKTKNVILLINNNNCTGCIENICTFLNEHIDTSNKGLFVIIRTGANISQRRSELLKFSTLIPKVANHVFFDIQEKDDPFPFTESQDGMFKQRNIKYTPEILIIKKRKISHIRYKELFDEVLLRKKAAKFIMKS